MSWWLTKTCFGWFFRCGDEIVEVNDVVVYSMALNDVYAVLSQCTPGPVHIIVSRHPNPKVWLPALHTCIHKDNEMKKIDIKHTNWHWSFFFSHSFDKLSYVRVKLWLYFQHHSDGKLALATFDSRTCFCLSQISELQLNDAIAQAVENSKLKRDKSQWSISSKLLLEFTLIFKELFMLVRKHF